VPCHGYQGLPEHDLPIHGIGLFKRPLTVAKSLQDAHSLHVVSRTACPLPPRDGRLVPQFAGVVVLSR
jgi:hypothetical protein